MPLSPTASRSLGAAALALTATLLGSGSPARADTIIIGRPSYRPPVVVVRPPVVVAPYRPVYVAPPYRGVYVAPRPVYGPRPYTVTRYHGPRCSGVVVRGPYRGGAAVRC
ncbi:MAG: hypothetical protein ACT6XY_19590 [Phreatobacter sp.]|jgi:hypothetical protein|uniref:hypothetical protein n=1 Tax=Phreatobacter sp. TaxID=1966341 RepID=UPI004036F227